MNKQPPRQQTHSEPQARMRITYTTGGAIRYTGNLDLHRIWERAFRRVNLPVSYSNGFHPQPRLQLACALPLGMISHYELADLWLDALILPEKLQEDLNHSLPVGVRITRVEQVDLKEKPLQTRIKTAVYHVFLDPPLAREQLRGLIDNLLSSPEIRRERRGKMYDLRPLVESLDVIELTERAGGALIKMNLSAREGATGRPEEVLSVMGIDPLTARIERINLLYD